MPTLEEVEELLKLLVFKQRYMGRAIDFRDFRDSRDIRFIDRPFPLPKQIPNGPPPIQPQPPIEIKTKVKKSVLAKETPGMNEQELNEKSRDLTIDRQGTRLVVPEGVGLDVAIHALKLRQREEEQPVSINHMLPIEVAEGMVGFLRVLEREFGFVANTGTRTIFGPRPPAYLGIETQPGHRESIPVGRLQIPGIEGWLTPTYGIQGNRVVFRVEGECKGKDRYRVDQIIAMVEEECRKNSIYRGHAIMTSFPEVDETGSLEDNFPVFAKLNPVRPEEVIFSQVTEDQITIALYTPIRRTEACRKNKIPLKRGILLEGPYGTGKTLTAGATATLCAENGWTFIYLKDVTRLAYAYAFAAQYQPAVIFSEDIDQVLTSADYRDEKINDILNSMDGINSNGLEIITVLTTNHLEKITKAMLRPGRLDTVVNVRAPDRGAAIRLVRMYAGELLDKNSNLESSEVGDLLSGVIPALIREIVERSKLAAIRREGDDLVITPGDIEVTARSMRAHMTLLEPSAPDTRSDREKAAQIVADAQIKAAGITASSSQASEEHHHGGNGKSKVTHEQVTG